MRFCALRDRLKSLEEKDVGIGAVGGVLGFHPLVIHEVRLLESGDVGAAPVLGRRGLLQRVVLGIHGEVEGLMGIELLLLLLLGLVSVELLLVLVLLLVLMLVFVLVLVLMRMLMLMLMLILMLLILMLLVLMLLVLVLVLVLLLVLVLPAEVIGSR